jgi:large subunit ribosomal protein LP0
MHSSPFTYGMTVEQIYDGGQTFAASVLDIEESQLLKAFTTAITTIATISLAVNYPTLPSVIHSIVNSYKKVLAIAVETDYSWEGIEELKDRIANPDAYASAAPAAGSAPAADAAPAAAAKEEEPEEESDDDMGLDLFG